VPIAAWSRVHLCLMLFSKVWTFPSTYLRVCLLGCLLAFLRLWICFPVRKFGQALNGVQGLVTFNIIFNIYGLVGFNLRGFRLGGSDLYRTAAVAWRSSFSQRWLSRVAY